MVLGRHFSIHATGQTQDWQNQERQNMTTQLTAVPRSRGIRGRRPLLLVSLLWLSWGLFFLLIFVFLLVVSSARFLQKTGVQAPKQQEALEHQVTGRSHVMFSPDAAKGLAGRGAGALGGQGGESRPGRGQRRARGSGKESGDGGDHEQQTHSPLSLLIQHAFLPPLLCRPRVLRLRNRTVPRATPSAVTCCRGRARGAGPLRERPMRRRTSLVWRWQRSRCLVERPPPFFHSRCAFSSLQSLETGAIPPAAAYLNSLRFLSARSHGAVCCIFPGAAMKRRLRATAQLRAPPPLTVVDPVGISVSRGQWQPAAQRSRHCNHSSTGQTQPRLPRGHVAKKLGSFLSLPNCAAPL